MDKVINEELMRRMHKEKEVILTIERRKLLSMGYAREEEKNIK